MHRHTCWYEYNYFYHLPRMYIGLLLVRGIHTFNRTRDIDFKQGRDTSKHMLEVAMVALVIIQGNPCNVSAES